MNRRERAASSTTDPLRPRDFADAALHLALLGNQRAALPQDLTATLRLAAARCFITSSPGKVGRHGREG